MYWCGLFGLRGGAPRRAKRGGSQWEACFEGSSDAVGGRRQRLFQEFFQRLLGRLRKRPAVLGDVEYGQAKGDDQGDDEPCAHLPGPEAVVWVVERRWGLLTWARARFVKSADGLCGSALFTKQCVLDSLEKCPWEREVNDQVRGLRLWQGQRKPGAAFAVGMASVPPA